ncbi:uncharacterized protein LOC122061568 isoform X2 [Macadamia integrifolia]|uniref:uncharacterized protein LOC122061568 isoform X2 n=1 Tax=Macadamia integrifolia TaxID=60698 RepID=UPI001C528897|nr:uncharacterized protein LOC122061568 isoform X2 [Macadamia integrifolia]
MGTQKRVVRPEMNYLLCICGKEKPEIVASEWIVEDIDMTTLSKLMPVSATPKLLSKPLRTSLRSSTVRDLQHTNFSAGVFQTDSGASKAESENVTEKGAA